MKEGVFYPDNTIQHKIEAIKNMAADICATSYTDISHLSNLMLALPNYDETPELGGKSGLNADGTPIQFCISSKKEIGRVGLLLTLPQFMVILKKDT